MRRNIDAWWPRIQAGAEAIVSTASGCGVTVKDYGHLLANDPAYADKAKRISELAKDISEVVLPEKAKLESLVSRQSSVVTGRIAFHSPCSLQHGMKLSGKTEALLESLGYELTPVPDPHLCCGSAGTYSVLQPELSQRLLANKTAALASGNPTAILTANIGCQMHLQGATALPVRHWIEALDECLSPSS
jgi:glycolate oxidase iron-sulfur subunit